MSSIKSAIENMQANNLDEMRQDFSKVLYSKASSRLDEMKKDIGTTFLKTTAAKNQE